MWMRILTKPATLHYKVGEELRTVTAPLINIIKIKIYQESNPEIFKDSTIQN